MKSTVAIYDSHWSALEAIELLKNKSFPADQISILGQARFSEGNMEDSLQKNNKKKGNSIGIILGSSMGVLTKARILPVVESGFIFGAGAIVGAITSFNMDYIGVRIASILKIMGINKNELEKYSDHLHEGKFLVVAQGGEKDVLTANRILSESSKDVVIQIQ